MKRIVHYSFLILSFLSLQGCDLSEKVYSDLVPEQFYKSEADLEKAMMAVYNSMNRSNQDWDGSLHSIVFMPGQYVSQGRSVNRRVYALYSYGNTDSELITTWNVHYRTIGRTNIVVDRAPTIPGLSPATVARYQAEARFVRALHYFNLVRLWGAIPLILNETTDLTNDQPRRSTIAKVYAAIEADLLAAEKALPAKWSDNTKGRPTIGSAKTLLGKVYLTMAGKAVNDGSKLALARTKLKEVIDNAAPYGYGLLASYRDVFDVNKEDNQDLIYVVKYANIIGQGSVLAFFNAPLNSLFATANGQYHYGMLPPFYDLFESTDIRRDVTVIKKYYSTVRRDTVTYGDNFTGNQYTDPVGMAIGKFQDGPPGKAPNNVSHANDFPVLRYADVLLMFAEAENELNGATAEAFAALNLVRARGKAKLLSGLTKDTFRTAVRRERLLELTGELHEFFDIQRWGTLKETIEKSVPALANGVKYDPRFELYPIPSSELNTNPNVTLDPQ